MKKTITALTLFSAFILAPAFAHADPSAPSASPSAANDSAQPSSGDQSMSDAAGSGTGAGQQTNMAPPSGGQNGVKPSKYMMGKPPAPGAGGSDPGAPPSGSAGYGSPSESSTSSQ